MLKVLRSALLVGLLIGPVAVGPSIAGAAQNVITFDALVPGQSLDGQYPTGIVDWGTGSWLVSGPIGSLTNNSIFFNSGLTSADFSFVTSERLLSIDAYNSDFNSATVSLTCAGQPNFQVVLAAGQLATISPGWTGTCTGVTVSATNGGNTNFNNIFYEAGPGPFISNVQVSNIGPTGATVTWTTSSPATSQVEYGTTPSYGSSTALDSTLVVSHSAILGGLSPQTGYHYRASSKNASGNLAVSMDYTFMTGSASCVPPVANPIVCENSKAGTPSTQWLVSGYDPSIMGYTTDISVNKGGTVYFKVNTPASSYHIDIYRMGYYAGMGARQVASVQPSVALPQTQPACVTDATTGLIDCGKWGVSATWIVPSDAVSGIYFANLVRADTGGTSQLAFVVRDDASNSPLLFQTADTTWQAYNDYGGNSLYTGSPAGRAYKVSYNRPFQTTVSKPESWVFNAEYPMVRFLEANGYNVSYASGVDTDRRGAAALQTHKVFVSVGHDEYWSANQRANVETARGAGVNLAFFSGNEVFWKTRWEPSIDGTNTAYRTLVTYKETMANGVIDPNDPPTWTGTWRDPRFSPPADGGRPENALTSTLFMVNGPNFQALQVPAADGKMRFWRNTSVAQQAAGQTATLTAGCSCLLGYEWDADIDNGARPAGRIGLSTTTATVQSLLLDYGSTYGTGTATHRLGLYRAASGALVFGAGTVNWAYGLDGYSPVWSTTPELAMQQATVNLLADMRAQPATLQAGLVAATASTDTTPPHSNITTPSSGATVAYGTPLTISGTAVDSGGGVVGGVEVSTDGGTTWHPATGRESWSYSWTPNSSGAATLRSRAVDDSGNLETPSAGITVTVQSAPCPCSLWPNTAVPGTPNGSDASSVELGVQFHSDVNGYITGLRFYKGSGNSGTHVGSLWTSTGTLLAQATFTNETATGWQKVNFATPVAITANTTYVASYHAPNGGYPSDQGYFSTSGVDPVPLHAPATGAVVGGNGVYAYSSSSVFPNGTYQGSNYWVDLVFNQTSSASTTQK